MAADAYLRAAAGDLEKAAQEVKNQMHMVRSDFNNFEREVMHYISDQEGEIRELAARMLAQHDDPQAIAIMTARTADLRRDIDRRKSELNQRRSDMNRALSMKEGTMNELLQEAHTLARQAGNPALR